VVSLCFCSFNLPFFFFFSHSSLIIRFICMMMNRKVSEIVYSALHVVYSALFVVNNRRNESDNCNC